MEGQKQSKAVAPVILTVKLLEQQASGCVAPTPDFEVGSRGSPSPQLAAGSGGLRVPLKVRVQGLRVLRCSVDLGV